MILHELIDYDILRVIWWGLLGVLLIGFALTDGFDMGVGALLPFVAETDVERRVAINTVGPVWEGNQVWFILGRRRDLRRLAAALRGLASPASTWRCSWCSRRFHPAAGRVQVPLEAG
jgi:hypothetical protein